MTKPTPPGAVILIIDADPITLIGMAAVLDMQGYECHCASDAAAARKAVTSLPLDLIICDTQIADVDAVQLCRDLRQQANIDDVPVILIAASKQSDSVPASTHSTHTLCKPFEPEHLIEAVAKMLWMPHLLSSRLRQTHSHSSAAIPAPAATRRTSPIDSQRI